jgi:hypothetical protein
MKRVMGMAALVGALALSSGAFAGNAGDGSGYGTQPGFDNAIANSNGCAGAGAFGAFGKGANLGIANPPGNPDQPGHATFLGSYPGPGTDGQQTGLNNSSLCGNRQGNLP